jgi:tyrosyl-tRNA synthetase
MILQSYDFAELNKRIDCTVQLGGSDQWGNITGGTELTRRMHGNHVYGVTLPLVTKADGTKFGKTETGTIWLDANKTSPYAFYQFWLNSADADVYKFLGYFTFLSPGEIADIEKADQERAGRPEAQSILANSVTGLVHGEEGLSAAKRITQAMFSGSLTDLTENDFAQLSQDGLPTSVVSREVLAGMTLTSLLTEEGVATSGKQVKDALGRNAVIINGQGYGSADNADASSCFPVASACYGKYFVLKLGKKKHHMFVVSD